MWLNGRASVCGTEGYRFKSYHSPILLKKLLFSKTIKKKLFKKKKHLLLIPNNTNTYKLNKIIKINLKNLQCYKYQIKKNTFKKIIKIQKYNKNNTTINLSQIKFNQKGTISSEKILNTFSVGSILKYFKIKQCKYIRRSIKGLKIFLNFIKNIFVSKYLTIRTNLLILNVVGIDYNIKIIKNGLKNLVKNKNLYVYTIYNIKVSFTKTKDKKIKSIKKRLKKKILKNFLKNMVNL